MANTLTLLQLPRAYNMPHTNVRYGFGFWGFVVASVLLLLVVVVQLMICRCGDRKGYTAA
jgi:hypothetical protein